MKPGTAMLSRSSPKSTERISERDLQAVIDTAKRNFKNLPEIITLESPADALPELREAVAAADASDKSEAIFHDGAIILFRTRIGSIERAEQILLSYELRHYDLRGTLGPYLDPVLRRLYLRNLRHRGLRSVLGRNLDPVLRGLYLRNTLLRDRADAIRKGRGLSSLCEAIEEAMVDMSYAELTKLSGRRRFVLYVRDALRGMGFGKLADAVDAHLEAHYGAEQVSAIEITRILQAAEEWVRNVKTTTDALSQVKQLRVEKPAGAVN